MQLTQSDSVIRTESLLVELGGLPILREISIEIGRGELTALMGGNGSGKTTLVRALLGLTPHQGGRVELFGVPAAEFHDWRRIGYVPQRGAVNIKQATVKEVVATGRLSTRRPFAPTSATDRSRITAALAAVGLADRARHPFTQLSGGQQQRVLIARALAAEVDLLVLDEPFAGVDLRVQDSLAELIGGLNAAGTTVLVVLHETGALAPLLTKCVVLREGRVVHVGAPPEEAEHYHETELPPERPLLTGLIGEAS
ncbi:metal ABC transporter ATP-binding protein [Propionicimonas sp.]|jgi:zinc transport system ATP-binding protein|uniref:metal ABC transporter ATP-binding protein n=1 Tax=Propionicimonas sp. TaxID=1955623 RepID=UPI0025FCDEC2|nr:ATP-binding cassette domain-containing protein [Propionicimonas sp.]MCG2804598.1 ATP-binding cassette domain-containing protein [Propionicimonas sp.]